MSGVELRDKYYEYLVSDNVTAIDAPVSLTKMLFDTQQLKLRSTSSFGTYIRNRFIHKQGYIAKGNLTCVLDCQTTTTTDTTTMITYPVIVRLSVLTISSSLRIVGFGIRAWTGNDGNNNSNTKDGIFLCILTDQQQDLQMPLANYIPDTIPTSTGKFIAGLLTGSFNLTGFDSTRNDVSGIFPSWSEVQPFSDVTVKSSLNCSISDIITNVTSQWSFCDNNNNVIGNLQLEQFNINPELGYQILFHHTLLPRYMPWWQHLVIGKFIYITYFGINFLFTR